MWRTSCELFNLSCSVLNQLHLNCFENDMNASANNAFRESLFWNEWMNELVDGQRANSFWAATKTGSKGMHTRWIFNIVYFHCCYLAYAENADARGVTYFKSSSELPDHPFTVQRTAILSSLFNSVYAKRWNSKQYRAELSWYGTIAATHTWPRPKWYAWCSGALVSSIFSTWFGVEKSWRSRLECDWNEEQRESDWNKMKWKKRYEMSSFCSLLFCMPQYLIFQSVQWMVFAQLHAKKIFVGRVVVRKKATRGNKDSQMCCLIAFFTHIFPS